MSFVFKLGSTIGTPFRFSQEGVQGYPSIVGTFTGELPQLPVNQQHAVLGFNFKACRPVAGFHFPYPESDICQSITLDGLTGSLSAEFQYVNFITATFGMQVPETFDFRLPTYNFDFRKLERLQGLSGTLVAEFSDEVLPFDGALDTSLDGITATISARFDTKSIGVMGENLGGVSGFVDGMNVLNGTFTSQLQGITGNLYSNIGLYGSLDSETGLTGSFEGYVPPNATFGGNLGVTGAFLGDNVTNGASVEGALQGLFGVVKGRVYQWANLDLLRGKRCIVTDTALTLNKSKCYYSDITSTLITSKCMIVVEGQPVYGVSCLNVDTAGKLYQVICTDNAKPVDLYNAFCANRENGIALYTDSCYNRARALTLDIKICVDRHDGAMLQVDKCFNVEDTAQHWYSVTSETYGLNEHYNPPSYQDTFIFASDGYASGFEWVGQTSTYQVKGLYSKGLLMPKTCSHSHNGDKITVRRCSDVEEAQYPDQGFCPLDEYIVPTPPIFIDGTRVNYTIPDNEVYIVDLEISAFIEGTSTEIPLTNVNISYSPSAVAWQMSASMYANSDVEHLRPDSITGEPTRLRININGEQWTFLVEEISTGRSFVDKKVSITGSGVTSVLHTPYVLQESYIADTDLTVHQIALDILDDPSWTLNWNMQDWLIPTGTFSYTNLSKMQGLLKVVQLAQGNLRIDRIVKTITVVARYPVLPWNNATTTPNWTFSEDVIVSVNEVTETVSDVNGVMVHGNEPSGYLGKVVYYGTAGDNVAPIEHNDLATSATAIQHIGEQIMATYVERPKLKEYKIPLHSVDFPLQEIGDFVKIRISPSDTDIPDGTHVDFLTVYGCVNSVSVSTSGTEAYQSITLGDHDVSMLSTFKALIPQEHLSVGTVTGQLGTKMEVTLIGGGVIAVRGTASMNSTVYVKGDEITGVLPNLTPTADVVVG